MTQPGFDLLELLQLVVELIVTLLDYLGLEVEFIVRCSVLEPGWDEA